MSLRYEQILTARDSGRLQIIPGQLLVVAYQDEADAPAIRLDVLEELAAKDAELALLTGRVGALEAALSRLIRAQGRK